MTAALAAATVGMVSVAAAAAYHEPEAYFTLRDPEITESSGIAASARADDLFFTHNDSGDTARFFAVDDHGCTQAVFDLADRGTIAIDWEDMARGPKIDGKPTLFLADIGDNFAARPNVVVYRVVEPKVKRQPSPADPAAACSAGARPHRCCHDVRAHVRGRPPRRRGAARRPARPVGSTS